jgi:signal transduction histidine kinase
MRSLALKFTLAFLVVALTGGVLVAVFVQIGTVRAFDRFVQDQDQYSFVNILSQHYQVNNSWDGVGQVIERGRFMAPGPYSRRNMLVLVDQDGKVVVGDNGYESEAYPPPPGVQGSIPIEVDGRVVGWLKIDPKVRTALPGSPEADFVERVTQAVSYSALGATVLALLLGVLLARTLTRPIRELTEATQAVAQGQFGHQVTVRTKDELGALASSFNRMSADLARASDQRRQMTADIAHELRTPLSVLLGYTEALQDGKLAGSVETFEVMHGEARQLSHLVDDLRTLALADAGELPLTLQPVDPQALLDRTAAAYRAQAQEKGIELRADEGRDLPTIEGDPERLIQVLGNLVTNALRHTPSGGLVILSAEARPASVCLRVQDTGTGIAPEDLPHIFQRFYRGDESRQQSGESGLGLAIARSIIEMHGGEITAESAPGAGATFTIVLPVNKPVGDPHSPNNIQ